MRKRIFPALLALVLTLSIVPVAFAVPMTLVQQTTGEFADVNKQFVYYILADNIPSGQKNIEKIKTQMRICNCGFTVFGFQENATSIWENHYFNCGGRSLYGNVELYKITLKNGETINLNTQSTITTIYAVQENNCSISYSTDGVNFTDYVNDGSMYLSETTVASLKFTGVKDGTLTIKRSDDSSPNNASTNDNGSNGTTNTNPYKDVSTGDWFYPAVEYMSGKKYMTGYSDTEFGPNDTLSRAMFVTVLYRVSGEKVNASATKFTDVPQNIWYTEAVAWAVENGIANGTGDTTFSPNSPVTRQEMATFMKRYIDSKGIALSKRPAADPPVDMSASSFWAKDAVEAAYQYGLLYATYSKLNPMEKATRTDAVVAFYNLLRPSGNSLLLPRTEACTHNWTTRHVAEVGHYEESSGTHKVTYYTCDCGFSINSDDTNYVEIWKNHKNPLTGCRLNYAYVVKDIPNGDSQYIIDTPAHDETYCTICGAVK